MKSMTCSQMGGPCEELIYGNTVKEMVDNGTEHLKDMSIRGDMAHMKTLKMMEDMQKNPDDMKKWNEEFAKKFMALASN